MTEQNEQLSLQKHPVYIRGICKMKNAVGREIPEEILEITGKEVFQEIIIKTEPSSRREDRSQRLS